jgi:histidine triad (HIT) family protein
MGPIVARQRFSYTLAMNDCIFCKIANKEIPAEIIYEDEQVLSFLDIKGLNPGHSLIIPKAHFQDIYALDEITASHLFSVAPKIARAIKRATHADGINIGMNNESAAGQVVFHAHVHVIPRYTNDGYHHWERTKPSIESPDIADQIKKAL